MKVKNLSRPFIIAHRGASFYEPENTISSVKKAIELKADAVEVDVRLSRDGFPVIIHDSTVDRITGNKGQVRKMTVNELKRLKVGNKENIALLNEIIDIVKGKAVLVLDLKEPEVIGPSLKIVEEKNMIENTILISEDPNILRKLSSMIEKSCYLGFSYSQNVHLPSIINGLRIFMVSPHYSLVSKNTVDLMHKSGVKIVPWGANDVNLLKDLLTMEVDGIITDRPDLIGMILIKK